MVDGRLAATGDLAALRAAMTDKPRQVHVRASAPRALAAALMEIEGVDGIALLDGALDVTTTDPVAFARALPVVAQRRSVTVSEVAPVDESMESVFRYLVEASR